MKDTFDPKNPRVKLARQKKSLNTPALAGLCYFFSVAMLAGGGTLLFIKEPIGWIFIGFAVWPLMLVFWVKNALKSVPVKNTDYFTDLISEDLLLLLTDKTTPTELVKILPKSSSGAFLMAIDTAI